MTTVVFDAVSNAAGDFATPASPTLTFTHTPVGTPSAVAVVVSWGFSATTITSVTYGGVTMANEITAISDGWPRTAIYGLASPPSGAQTVIVTFSGTEWCGAAAVSVTGSDTTTCFRGSAKDDSAASGNSATVGVVCPSELDDLIIDILYIGTSTAAASPQVERAEGAASVVVLACSTKDGAATSTDMVWACGTSSQFAICGASFKAGGGGGGGLVIPVAMNQYRQRWAA